MYAIFKDLQIIIVHTRYFEEALVLGILSDLQ